MNRRVLCGIIVVATIAVVAGACGGGGGGSPTTPTPNPNPGGGGGGSTGTTITITASGVSPRALTVPRGTRVTFVNNDNRPHEMNSNPHPTHGDCPEIDEVSFLAVGQSKQTGNLNTVRTCGYHDHQQDVNTSLQGTITIQ